ncbi:MAG: hypothetical protein J7K77_01185 [Dehalococcoidales bacterium]|nr:hypothetical protein [Dehalococcoidales bacterium]
MSEKKMVVVNDTLMRKIDRYRGQLDRADFVNECLERLLRSRKLAKAKTTVVINQHREPDGTKIAPPPAGYVNRQDFEQFQRNINNLQREFMDFFIKYGDKLAGGSMSEKETKDFSDELRRLLRL